MMMTFTPFFNEFKSRGPVVKVGPLDHPHFLQQVHRPVNCRQITFSLGQSTEDFPIRERMRMPPEDFEDNRSRTGNFSGVPSQTGGQFGQLPLSSRRGMLMRLQDVSIIKPGGGKTESSRQSPQNLWQNWSVPASCDV